MLSNREALGSLLPLLYGMVLTGIWFSMLGKDNLRSVLHVLFGTVAFFIAANLSIALVSFLFTNGGLEVNVMLLTIASFIVFLSMAYVLTFSRRGQTMISESHQKTVGKEPIRKVIEGEAIPQLLAKLKAGSGWDDETEQRAIIAARAMLEAGKTEKEVSERFQAMGISRRGAKSLVKSGRAK